MMATLYISGPPNFLLALCPTDIDPASLNVMVAFAVGGLLGDTLFHLLPEIFLGEVPEGEVRAVLVEPNKNLLLGVAIMVGFVTFVAMDKALRIATGGAGHTHDHSHSNGHAVSDSASATGASPSPSQTKDSLRNRKAMDSKPLPPTPPQTNEQNEKKEVKLSAYLNIIADFTHNITDGLALSSSFYASPTIGATTTLAVFCHEIPHEVGDFALLIQGGMSKKLAMGLQFVTALGAVLGTIIGITVQEFGGSGAAEAVKGAGNVGLAGTSLSWGDLLLPFTAGTFLYVGTVGAIPEMLETGPNKMKELRTMILQFVAMAAGAGIMLGYVFLVPCSYYTLTPPHLFDPSLCTTDEAQHLLVIVRSRQLPSCVAIQIESNTGSPHTFVNQKKLPQSARNFTLSSPVATLNSLPASLSHSSSAFFLVFFSCTSLISASAESS